MFTLINYFCDVPGIFHTNSINTKEFSLKWVDSSPPGQNGRHFADDNFKRIFVNEIFCISFRISLKFVPKGSVDNTLVQVMV